MEYERNHSPYQIIKRRAVLDLLEKYPNASIRSLARIAVAELPEYFNDIEQARSFIRTYTGSMGKKNRKNTKFKKYFRNETL